MARSLVFWLVGLELLLASFSRLGWLAEDGEQMAILSLPIMALLLSEMVEASMFIAAFVAGLALQWRFRPASREDRFYGLLGIPLSRSVFFLFGLIALIALQSLEWRYVVYGLLSLTLIRIGLVAGAGQSVNYAAALVHGLVWPQGAGVYCVGAGFSGAARAGRRG